MLRGLGAAASLPLLDAMFPALTPMAKAAAAPGLRFGAVYFPNGAIMQQFTPKTFGSDFEFTPILKPFEAYRDNLVVVTNLTRSHPGSQVGDHAVSAAGFLTGVWPKRTEAEDVLANTTIDQVVAQQIGQQSPLPSLELATEDFPDTSAAALRVSVAPYMNTLCWSTPKTPLPMETNPRAVFERLFGEAGNAGGTAGAARRRSSILDSLAEDAKELEQELGPKDRARLGDYLDNVREIERRIQQAEARGAARWPRRKLRWARRNIRRARGIDVRPGCRGVSGRHDARVHVHDVARTQPAHLSADRRHGAAPFGFAPSEPTPEDRADGEDQHYYVELHARFLAKLRATPDGEGSLLDHSLLAYGAGMADSNGHASDPLPLVMIGGGAGKGARHVELPARTPIGNLWRNVAERFGRTWSSLATARERRMSSGKRWILALLLAVGLRAAGVNDADAEGMTPLDLAVRANDVRRRLSCCRPARREGIQSRWHYGAMAGGDEPQCGNRADAAEGGRGRQRRAPRWRNHADDGRARGKRRGGRAADRARRECRPRPVLRSERPR